ncbi:hypothetical protein Lesp02_16560 [Lentzea sp. NBRC 105346]|uniref:hypothetical protein n=1 Tax=Lentzea sp. NBRC 105346 TaxID=3032205 RepID=UPI0024A4C4A3|nr:hypothetical protein [Lentzea sp. NBRC 105346]GLZ29466.1 hypothetical protein Lesp02_16560 [Lentzea sp. NBRC 105346]
MYQPIGYYLKRLDSLIDAAFERTITEEGLTRRHWQALNGPDAAPPSIMAELEARGWAARGQLTPEGESARAALMIRVQGVRDIVMAGLSPQDYENTVRVLSHMTDNLQRVSP